MRFEAPRLALLSRETATIATPPEATSLRWRARNLSGRELTNPTPDIAIVISDVLDFSGANVKLSEKRGSLVGLHARQLGYDYNIFTVDWSGTTPPSQRPADYQPHFRVFANVTITDRQGSQISREG